MIKYFLSGILVATFIIIWSLQTGLLRYESENYDLKQELSSCRFAYGDGFQRAIDECEF